MEDRKERHGEHPGIKGSGGRAFVGKATILICALAALTLMASGCAGWRSGSTFRGEFNPEDKDPVTAVKKFFASMEWKKTVDEKGNTVPDPDQGRDFDLFLEVVNPDYLKDPQGMVIDSSDLEKLRQEWNSREWEIEFRDIQLEEKSNDGREAVVEITGGSVRYIGKKMFNTPEYKVDDFGHKKGEIYLRWYDDPANDPLTRLLPDKAGPRWVIVGGLDLSEQGEYRWGETG
ncbi:MAG: hypothetical protein WHT46_05740 [Candidatus Geothermincolales bacterium]